MDEETTQTEQEAQDVALKEIISTGENNDLAIAQDPLLQAKILGTDDMVADNPIGSIVPGKNEIGEGLTVQEYMANQEKLAREAEEAAEDAVREEAPPEEGEEEVAEEEPSEEEEFSTRELTDDQLDNTFMKRIVNGKEELVSLREVRDGYQIKEAGLERLDLAKEAQREYHELNRQLREELARLREPQPVAPEIDEYSSPEDRQLAEMRKEINNLRSQWTSAETSRLQAAEDDMIRSRIRSHLGSDDINMATNLISRVKSEDPAYGAIADALFSGPPTSQDHMNQRVAFMDSLLIKAKSLEMPTIIEKAKEEGKKELKREKKSKLASVETTQKVPEESRAEKIKKAAARGDQGMAELGMELFIKNQFPEI